MKKIFIFLPICFFLFAAGNASAANSIVLISEIQAAGGASNDEFIELYNPTAGDIDLSGWSVQYRGGGAASYTKKNFSTGHIVPAHGFFLIAHSDYTGAVAANMSHSTFALSGTGGTVFLVNNQILLMADADDGETVVDGVAYGSGANLRPEAAPALAPGIGKSIARRITNGLMQDTDDNSADFVEKDMPDPQNAASAKLEPDAGDIQNQDNPSAGGSGAAAEETSRPAATSSAKHKLGDVVINEFVSDPADGEEEWVELYNATGKEIDLSGWIIEEGSGAKINLSGKIGASGENKFFVITKPKGNLNNSGDIIILRDGANNLIDQVTYGNWNDGNISDNAPTTGDPKSTARKLDGRNSFNNSEDFTVTFSPTKGKSNIIIFTDGEAEESEKYDHSDDIFISEIFPNPRGDDRAGEFVELYNAGERDINLSGWAIANGTKKYFIKAEAGGTPMIKAKSYLAIYRSQSKIALNNSGDSVKLFQPLKESAPPAVKYKEAVEGQSYNLIARNSGEWKWSEAVTPGKESIIKTINHAPIVDFDFPSEIFAGAPVVFDSSDTFDEDGDKLRYDWDFGDGVKNNLPNPEHTFLQAGKYKVKLIVGDGASETKKEKTINAAEWQYTVAAAGDTAGEKREIIINEILPSPEGDDKEGEWIELYNKGKLEVNLLGWKVEDNSKSHYRFTDDLRLGAGNFYLLERNESGLALNNNGDIIKLFSDIDELLDQVKYEDAPEGLSYARQNGRWVWTSVLTPGEENKIIVSEKEQKNPSTSSGQAKKWRGIVETTLEKIKEFDAGDFVKVKGTVAVKPGILGSQIFYIVGSPGIQVYSYYKKFPVLTVGDYVEVAGELSVAYGEMRLKTKEVDDIKVVEHRDPPAPTVFSCGDISEEQSGQLVKIAGEITEKKGSLAYLDDGTGEVEIYIKKTAGIDARKLKEGEEAAVTGIVSQSRGEIRILPRFNDDVAAKSADGEMPGEVVKENEWEVAARNKNKELFKYMLVIIVGFMAVMAALLTKGVIRIKK